MLETVTEDVTAGKDHPARKHLRARTVVGYNRRRIMRGSGMGETAEEGQIIWYGKGPVGTIRCSGVRDPNINMFSNINWVAEPYGNRVIAMFFLCKGSKLRCEGPLDWNRSKATCRPPGSSRQIWYNCSQVSWQKKWIVLKALCFPATSCSWKQNWSGQARAADSLVSKFPGLFVFTIRGQSWRGHRHRVWRTRKDWK